MVAEPVVRVVIRVAVELVRRAMEVLAAALGVDQNHHARATAVLGVEVAGKRLEFADGVETQRRIFAVVRAYVGVDDAVQEEVIRRAAHSVDIEVVGLVEHQAKLRIVVRDYAGQGGQQRFEVSAIQRLLRHLPLVNDSGVARSRGVNQGCLSGDGHGLRGLSERQSHLPETKTLILVEHHVVAIEFPAYQTRPL